MIKRINLYGGPGVGKSTTANNLVTRLKNRIIHNNMDIQIELIQEYVKSWAWEGRKPKGFDQVYICAKQMRREEIPLRNGVDVVVTDSPLLLQCAYARKSGVPCWEALVSCVETFEKEYPGLHIFLDRGERPYLAKGRYETHEQAKEMDKYIRLVLDLYLNKNYLVVPYDNMEQIENLVMSQISPNEKSISLS